MFNELSAEQFNHNKMPYSAPYTARKKNSRQISNQNIINFIN